MRKNRTEAASMNADLPPCVSCLTTVELRAEDAEWSGVLCVYCQPCPGCGETGGVCTIHQCLRKNASDSEPQP